jgi:hypothetical protein
VYLGFVSNASPSRDILPKQKLGQQKYEKQAGFCSVYGNPRGLAN